MRGRCIFLLIHEHGGFYARGIDGANSTLTKYEREFIEGTYRLERVRMQREIPIVLAIFNGKLRF
jgi:hypothetical protein